MKNKKCSISSIRRVSKYPLGGNLQQSPYGAIGTIGQQAITDVADVINYANIEGKDYVSGSQHIDSDPLDSANSINGLYSNMASTQYANTSHTADEYFNAKAAGLDKSSNVSGALGDTAKGLGAGAAAGTMIMPGIGTAIGAIAGTVIGGIKGIFGASKKKKARNEAEEKAKAQATLDNQMAKVNNEFINSSFKTNGEAINNQNTLNTIKNISAYGGMLSKYGNGGFISGLHSNGLDWSNGVNIIGNGGTHEQNPNEGVQIGMDSQRIPNLLEQNEVTYDDYVFSDRLKVPEETLDKLHMKGKKKGKTGKREMTFAELVKEGQKESEERPNDPISKNGLDAFMAVARDSQEEVRMKKQLRDAKREFNKLPVEQQLAMLSPNEDNPLTSYACGGKLKKNRCANKFGNGGWDFDDILAYINAQAPSRKAPYHEDDLIDVIPTLYNYYMSNDYNEADPYAMLSGSDYMQLNPIERAIVDGNIDGYSSGYGKYSANIVRPKLAEPLNIVPEDTYIEDTPEGELEEDSEYNKLWRTAHMKGTEPVDDKVAPPKLNWLQYAPAVGTAAQAATNFFWKPSKIDTNLDENNDYLNVGNIKSGSIGNKLQYKPLDVNYEANRLAAQHNANNRALAMGSGPSRNALLLQNNYNNQIAMAEALRNADIANYERRQKVEDFNRATDMYNITEENRINMANLQKNIEMAKMKKANLELKLKKDMYNNDIANGHRQSVINSMGQLANTAGSLGKQWYDNDLTKYLVNKGVYKGANEYKTT